MPGKQKQKSGSARPSSAKSPGPATFPAPAQDQTQALQQAAQLHQAGQLPEAGEFYRRILEAEPDHAETNYLLGTLYLQQGRNDEAVPLLEKAVARAPSNAAAGNNLGVALKGLGRFAEAIDAYRAILDREPGNASALNNMGVAHMGLDEAASAAGCFRRAVEIKPGYVDALNNLGRALEALGDLDGAAAGYRQAIELKPDCGEAHLALASLGPVQPGHADAMRALYEGSGLNDAQRVYLAFALGKALEDAGDYDQAFSYFADGNRLYRAANPFELKNQADHFGRMEAIFAEDCRPGDKAGEGAGEGASVVDRAVDCAADGPAPVFVIGMPRSGTSLVEQILASHPEVHGAGERLYLHEECQRQAEAAGGALPGGFADFDEGTYQRIAEGYLGRLRRHAPGARRIVDKMPQNYLYLGVICRAFGGAKIIHCRRDAMDTCLSIYKRFFTSPHPYAYDLAELGGYYRLYEGLMAHWHRLLPGRIFEIAYEELVSDPEGEIRRLLAHCDLPFDPACLEFHKTDRVVATASAAQVRQPIYKGSVGAWKRYEKHLAPLRKALR